MTTHEATEPEQLALLRSTVRASRARPPRPRPEQAAELPVARVAVDVELVHLDRLFDYLVPAELAEQAQPGVRVRVRFAGRLVDGYVVERAAGSEHTGALAFLAKVVSAEPVGLFVDTFGTGTVEDSVLQEAITEVFDLRPAAIIRDLDLLRPIYAQTAAYGHFGRELPDFTWERTDRVDALLAATSS